MFKNNKEFFKEIEKKNKKEGEKRKGSTAGVEEARPVSSGQQIDKQWDLRKRGLKQKHLS